MAPRSTTKKPDDPFGKEDVKDNTVAETTKNDKLTVTLKGGAGFDAPWVVVHAENAADALAQLQDPTMKELLDFAAETGSYFASKGKPAVATGGANNGGGSSTASGKTCSHGSMTFRSGSSNGRTWQGWFCPTPKGTPDQCKPEFVK